jgi:hypothetical protein
MENITKLFVLCLYHSNGLTITEIERYLDYEYNKLEIAHVIRMDLELNNEQQN